MDRRKFLVSAAGAGAGIVLDGAIQAQAVPVPAASKSGGKSTELADHTDAIFPGIWRFRFGTPESITPVQVRHYGVAADGLLNLPKVDTCPVKVTAGASARGCLVRIPLAPNEAVYGLGLQLMSFMQRGKKKKLRVNADPKMDTGDSHAPVPFYVTTRGYGVLIDTARYAQFYCGNKKLKGTDTASAPSGGTATGQDALPLAYRQVHLESPSEMLVEIPVAQGIDVYVFGGPSVMQAIQRYNLFSGGGALPPRWGLGVWYRAYKGADQNEVTELAREFRRRRIPCDVIGLEPGWQSHAYSCTFVFSAKFPHPESMLRELDSEQFRLNLWEHAFTHPESPIHQALAPYSGDYLVWDGLVPDFLSPEARKIFANFHETCHVEPGVSGYKLDECDNSDLTGNWSFPEISRFPSGADGEQMHSLFGLRYQDALQSIFERRKQRTYGLVRNSQALAAPYPYVLYSDLYEHRQFIRALANSGFSGLLWTPELRIADSVEDLIRRLQSAVLSPMAQIDGWYIKNPPWKQTNRQKNNQGELDPQWEQIEAQCRAVLELRMRLIPYIHAAFVRYHREGVPPFRALVVDYPDDQATWSVDDQYLVGDSLLVAPAFAGESPRSVYLPEGDWFDFWSGKRTSGKQTVTLDVPIEQIPIFVKAGAILPLAEPSLHVADPAAWRLEAYVYGDRAASITLYEDDGSYEPQMGEIRLTWAPGRKSGDLRRVRAGSGPQYQVTKWTVLT